MKTTPAPSKANVYPVFFRGCKSKNLRILFLLVVTFFNLALAVNAQVKIGNNPNTINSNSLLELESTDKGFLAPRVALNSTTSVSPLAGTVPSGMLVYSTGGTLPDGFYFWNGAAWKLVATSELNVVSKNASATLTKNETMVLASNDIILTLPSISSSDDSLSITVKNVGSYTHLVVVKGNSGATIDAADSAKLTRYYAQTFIASGGNWVIKNKIANSDNILDVAPNNSWTNLDEAIAFLNVHMVGPVVLRLSSEVYDVTSTIVIDLPYSLTIEGSSFGTSTIQAASGLANNPMFRCLSESYFKKLSFDGSSLASYGNNSGEDAIQLQGAGVYHEIKDCNFNQFNKAVVMETNAELWMFETDVNNTVSSGIEIAAGTADGPTLKISEVDFLNCATGINMLSGTNAVVSILNSTFYNAAGGTGINYVPATFSSFSSMFITNNAWNNIGTFFNGFDFSRSDGRDSKAFLQGNAGDPDRNPRCYINVLNSGASTSLSNGGTWYKASWDYTVTTTSTIKWTINNSSGNVNRITYQPTNRKDGYFVISGNLSCNFSSQTISIGIVKNGASGTRLGETTIRTGSSNTPTLFSTTVYLSNISNNDYFEIFVSNVNGGTSVKIQDLQWFADTK